MKDVTFSRSLWFVRVEMVSKRVIIPMLDPMGLASVK